MPRNKFRDHVQMWLEENESQKRQEQHEQQYHLHVADPEKPRMQYVKNVKDPETLRQQYAQAYLRNTEHMSKKYDHLCACVVNLHRSLQQCHMENQQHHSNTLLQLALHMHFQDIHRNVLNKYCHEMQQRTTVLETRVQELTTQIEKMMQMMQMMQMQQRTTVLETRVQELTTQIEKMMQMMQMMQSA